MLTKEQLLKGTSYREKFEVKQLGGTVLLRPLSSSEAARVKEITIEGVDFSGFIKSGMGKEELQDKITQAMKGDSMQCLVHNSSEAVWQICAYGMIQEDGTPLLSLEEVKWLPVGVPEIIAEKIKAISGMEEEEVEPFLE